MKKILSVVLALAVILSLAVCVAAATPSISTDKTHVAAGEKVIVTITLDEAIPASEEVTAVQIEVGYDKSVLTFESGVAGEGYSYLTEFVASKRNPVVKVNSGTDFSVKTLPAGTVATLTFVANQDADLSTLDLTLEFVAPTASGKDAVNTETSTKVTVCNNHKVETTTVAGTCTTKGYTEEKCATCGYSKKTEGAYGEHKTELVGAKEATCSAEGYTGDEVCSVCSETVKKGEAIAKKDHKYTVTGAKEATCTEEGYTGDKKCDVCGHEVKGEVIAKAAHKYTVTGAKEATCTEEGYTGDKKCDVCGHEVKGEVIAAKGHNYKDGVCANCGEKDPNYVPPTTEPEKDDVPETGDSIGVMVALLAVSALSVAFTVKRKEN